MEFNDIIKLVDPVAVEGPPGEAVEAIVYDSRKAGSTSAFVALRGDALDGHRFIDKAIENGCKLVIAQKAAPEDCAVTWVQVRDTRRALSALAAAFFGYPANQVKMVGVTGTNGKTTTCCLLHHILSESYRFAGMIGTVETRIAHESRPAHFTTPEPLELQGMISEMGDAACQAVAMEVSSHGLHQSRVRDVEFDIGVFTNLTQDHLDYHGSMESYFKAKSLLTHQMANQKVKTKPVMIVNGDDEWGRKLVEKFKDQVKFLTFGMGHNHDFRASDIQSTYLGTSFTLEAKGRTFLVKLPLIGRFNVFNALGVLATASALKLNFREAVKNLATAPQVPGRLENVSDNKPFKVFVDYAHTPDALDNALDTLRQLSPRKLTVVFGCGGNRDSSKRARMGAIADRKADFVIITSDNPRKEDPREIIKDIEGGMRVGRRYEVEPDRRKAIQMAVDNARSKDFILIAGKGHEDYQELADGRVHFDDREETRRILNEWLIPNPEDFL